jgi:hypothetical protein
MPEVETQKQNGQASPATPESAAGGPSGAGTPSGSPSPPPAADSSAAPKPKPKDAGGYALARVATRRADEARARAEAESKARADAEAKTAALEKELADLKARVKSDAIAVSVEHGGNPEENIRGYVEKTAPERKIEALERRLAEKDAEEQRRREAWEKQEQERQQRALEQAQDIACRSFVQTIRADRDKARYLNAELEDEEIYAAARQVQAFALQNSTSYSFEEVRDFLDKQAKLIHDKRTQRRTELLRPDEGTPGTAPETAANGQASGNGHRDTHRPTTRTGPKPPARQPPKQLSREEEEAEDLAMLRTAFAKDAASKR